MSPFIKYTGDSTCTLSYIAAGGNIEIYFLFKGTAKQIIREYQSMIGKPAMPPFWALGWHTFATNASEVPDTLP